jgi:hypothetical protein
VDIRFTGVLQKDKKKLREVNNENYTYQSICWFIKECSAKVCNAKLSALVEKE